jgi:hypothetical protein
MSINIENSPFNGFDNGKQWQSNLGGNENWKNRPMHRNGEFSMLIDINGDGLPDRVFDRNPKTDQQGFFVYSKPYKTPRLKVITNGFGIWIEGLFSQSNQSLDCLCL